MELQAIPGMAAGPGQYVGHGAPQRRQRLTEAEEIMYCYKVRECSQRTQHNWADCPCMHPEENARRRDPRKYRYLAEACPDWKQYGMCLLGNHCPFSHGLFEVNLHPTKFRTQMCSEFPRCKRKVCFFAHSEHALREPDNSNTYANTDEAKAVRDVLLVRQLVMKKVQEQLELRRISPDGAISPQDDDSVPRISMKVRRKLGMAGNKPAGKGARNQGMNGNGPPHVSGNGLPHVNGQGASHGHGNAHAVMGRNEPAAWLAAPQDPNEAIALAQYMLTNGQAAHGSPTNSHTHALAAQELGPQELAASMHSYQPLVSLSQALPLANAFAGNGQSAAALAVEAATQGLTYNQALAMSQGAAVHANNFVPGAFLQPLSLAHPTSYAAPMMHSAGQTMLYPSQAYAEPRRSIESNGSSQVAHTQQIASASAAPLFAGDVRRIRVTSPHGSPGYLQDALLHSGLLSASHAELNGLSRIDPIRELLKRGYTFPNGARSEDENSSGKSTPESHPTGLNRHFDVAAATEALAQNVLGRAGTLTRSQYQALTSAGAMGSDFSLFS